MVTKVAEFISYCDLSQTGCEQQSSLVIMIFCAHVLFVLTQLENCQIATLLLVINANFEDTLCKSEIEIQKKIIPDFFLSKATTKLLPGWLKNDNFL